MNKEFDRPTDSAPAATPSIFRVSAMNLPVNPGVERLGFVVSTESERFTLVLPSAWRHLALPHERAIRLGPADARVLVTVHFRNTPAAAGGMATAEFIRNGVLARFPGAAVTDEFPTRGLGSPGYGFDLEWRSSAGARQVARVAVATHEQGWIEAVLTAPASEIGRYHHDFSQVVGSVRRSGPTGKLNFQSVRPE